jgi:ribonuclease G
MSKELIISANRHETRVALLEDDQVVEIFHQRENEYSLAGSIHKGRVTRVLPGMQSAFVDIGLERDAFLYVSDFFEDNEEYDKIVTSVEDKVFKQNASAATAVPVERPEPVVVEGSGLERPGLERPAQAEAPANGETPAATASVSAPPAGAPLQQERRDERGRREGDDHRRGRGRRRGRGGRGGRGLPDSKFYSPRGEGEGKPEQRADSRDAARDAARETGREDSPQEAPQSAEATGGDDDFLVLPGEKLSKYRHEPHEATVDETDDSDQEDIEASGFSGAGSAPEDEAAQTESHLLAESAHHPAHESVHEAIAEPEDVAETPVVASTGVHGFEYEFTMPVEPQVETAEAAFEHPVEAEAHGELEAEPSSESDAEDAQAELAEAIEEAVEEALAGEEAEAEVAEAIAEAAEAGEVSAEFTAEAGENGEASEAQPSTEEEGPEPARIPTSLTATLREQGGRYPHRVSRRSRRRGRDGRNQEGRNPEARGPEARPAQEGREPGQRGPQQETRTVEGRAERPERSERPERQERPERAERVERAPSISDLLKEGQEIIVQIAKEPIGQKGARITSHIALPGRFLVYMPTVDHIGVSRKIPSDEERARLKRILQTHRTGIPGGYIVRTAGDGRTEEELRADMMFLYNLWLDMRQKAERRPAPLLIHHDLNVVERILRDQLTSSFKNIWVDNEELYEAVLSFVQRFQPALVGRVKMYTRSTPIFDEFGITSELEKALRPKVWLKSGGYIVINQTEALVAIDINTGKYVGKSNRLEDTIVKTNTDAIKEIVRQIRLRDLGGIIVVDFIDMDERKNRQKVMQALEEAMRADRAPYKILQFNDFGLVAITRKRVKQSLERTLCTPCPYCEGAGYVKSAQTVVAEILQEAHKIAKAVEGKEVLLRVNPEVARLLKSNQNSYLQELEEILGRAVMVKGDAILHQEKFDLA